MISKYKRATQAIFLVCGIALSSWAPMVPFAKDRLKLDDSQLGLLLLFLGTGAICVMPITDRLIHKFGTRRVILLSCCIIAVALPVLLVLKTWWPMAATLFLFGLGIGMVDVTMNAHGTHVQNLSGKHIMSSLHGLYSVGGLVGPFLIAFLIKLGVLPVMAALGVSVTLLVIAFSQYGSLMEKSEEEAIAARDSTARGTAKGQRSGWLNPAVLFIGLMCFIAFSSEGALLDWGALLLRDHKGADENFAGMGYACFSAAMALMRFTGDTLVSKVDSKRIVLAGSILAFVGYLLAIFAPWVSVSLLGFILVGIGAANIVPVFFTAAGRVENVPSSTALSVIATLGYTGMLAGPAVLGLIADRTSLPLALFVAGFLLLLAGIAYRLNPLKSR